MPRVKNKGYRSASKTVKESGKLTAFKGGL
jgi:hypothetical protein